MNAVKSGFVALLMLAGVPAGAAYEDLPLVILNEINVTKDVPSEVSSLRLNVIGILHIACFAKLQVIGDSHDIDSYKLANNLEAEQFPTKYPLVIAPGMGSAGVAYVRLPRGMPPFISLRSKNGISLAQVAKDAGLSGGPDVKIVVTAVECP